MKDLRIVIVGWNAGDELEACLSSLSAGCGSLDWDAVYIDNASTDQSLEIAEKISGKESRLQIIRNVENRGFAKACNQGIAGFDAKYVLLLNPDTHCPDRSLERFVHLADEKKDGAIFGPKLLNADGSVQKSVRAFPGVFDQLALLLKVMRPLRMLGCFRRFFGDRIDTDKEQMVDQLMGACFLIRKDFILEHGGLDERYYIWFEEVDYCMQARKAGKEIWYLPSVQVDHIGGVTFSRAPSIKKQKIFTASMVSYFEKWHPGWRAQWIKLFRPIGIGLVSLASFILDRHLSDSDDGSGSSGGSFKRRFLIWLSLIVGLEIVSALTIFHNVWNSIFAMLIAGIVLFISYKRPTLGASVLLAELIIGSKGALLQFGGWPGLSLRIGLFLAFVLGWGLFFLERKEIGLVLRRFWERKEWIILIAMAIYGTLRGYFLGQESFASDANAWGFLLLLLPVLHLSRLYGDRLRRDVLPVAFASLLWLFLKTIGLEYFFAHGFSSIASEAYLWVRRTGVGEVTLIDVNAFRIFFQSHAWLMPALLGSLAYLFSPGFDAWLERRKELAQIKISAFARWMFVYAMPSAWMMLVFAALGISMSRSIWLGCLIGIAVLLACYRLKMLIAWKKIAGVIGIGLSSLVLIFVAIAIPLPPVDYGSLSSIFGSRASTGDAAAVSRWNLLPAITEKIKEAPILGHGFGATVTYETKDPRILAQNKTGEYTTYAFEWGWLEHWVKMGLFGFLAVIYLIVSLFRRLWKSPLTPWVKYGAMATLVGLSVTHILTPYLNHPLGFGMLFVIEGMLGSEQ